MIADTCDEGFGRKVSWEDNSDAIIPSSHQMSFKQALHIVSTEYMMKLVVPDWAFGFTQRLRDTKLAFDELQVLIPLDHICQMYMD